MRFFLTVLIFLLGCSFNASAITLRADYPKRYTVQPGDTLWEIASKYLDSPWKWPLLWQANPAIKNPGAIYPGMILEMHFHKNQPYFKILSNGVVKLSPSIRPTSLAEPIPAVPLKDIKPFLNASLVMNENRLKNAPYVVGFFGEHLMGGQGDIIYVKKLHPSVTLPKGSTISYALYRENCPYVSPGNHRLGYKASLVGYGELVKGGEPATVLLTEIVQGIKLKDRVMLNDYPEFKLNFFPKEPRTRIDAKIIDLPPNYTQGSVGLVAVINKGQNAGLEAGDVLAINTRCRIVNDPVNHGKKVKLPAERIGELLIFRTFSKTSLGLVMRSTYTIHLKDNLTNP